MGSFIGTTIEWYDFYLYGTAAALVFPDLFFPSYSPLTGTLLALLTYSAGFIARPLGGVIMGHFGDRIGRKAMLVTSLMIMGLATTLIGVLPTFANGRNPARIAAIRGGRRLQSLVPPSTMSASRR